MRTALLVVDMQNQFFAMEHSKKSLVSAANYINFAIKVYREANQPIIFIQDSDAGSGPDTGSFDIHHSLFVDKNDLFITKHFSNSFWQTDLEKLLRDLNVDFVTICGYAAEYCITATYNGAIERGFDVTLLQHGLASSNPTSIDYVQSIFRTTSVKTLQYFLAKK